MNGHLSDGHLSDDQLLDRLYGLEEANVHLESCGECSHRWSELRARQAQLAVSESVSSEFLAAQRRAIYSQLGERPHHRLQWVPAIAMAGLLAIGLLMFGPAAPSHPIDGEDAQLFSDVYLMEQSTEPRAGAAMHALFEENQ